MADFAEFEQTVFRFYELELLFELGDVGFFGLRMSFVVNESLVERLKSILAIV